MKIQLARWISIVGHPLLLMPTATIGIAVSHQASNELIRSLILVLVPAAAIMWGFSIWSVKSGRWAHIDASKPAERRSLNWLLAAVLLTLSLVAWRSFPARELATGLLVSGLAVVVALTVSPILKLSLHTCFAAIAAGLLWPNALLVATGFFVVALVAWSRVVLGRHTIAEVLVGFLVGTASAIGYYTLTS